MPTWGDEWGNLWGPEPAEVSFDLSTLRQQRYAQCAYVLFVEGIEYAWVTDHSDSRELEGSGALSWIGQYESAAGLPYSRTVLGGLVMPSNLKVQPDLDLNTGLFRTSLVSFTLINHNSVLPTLFAQEGKESHRLVTRIAPGISNEPLITTQGETYNAGVGPWQDALYIDNETLGPSGQRRWWPCMPDQQHGGYGVTWVGPEHAVWQDPNDPNNFEAPASGPPIVQVSEQPKVFQGRKAALYRIYRDPNVDAPLPQAWAHWGDAHDAGDLVWFGTLRDAGNLLEGGLKWKISCFSQESWLKKNLGTRMHNAWMPVTSSPMTLSTEETYISVEFGMEDLILDPDAGGQLIYESVGFHPTTQLAATEYTSGDDLISDINTIVNSAKTGVLTAISYTKGGVTDFDSAGHQFEFNRDEVFIQAGSIAETKDRVFVKLTMHEKIWRYLGWDLPTQYWANMSEAGAELTQVFSHPGEDREPPGMGAGAAVTDVAVQQGYQFALIPGTGYHQAWFKTDSRQEEVFRNNNENPKYYEPLYGPSDTIILGDEDNKSFSVTDNFQYIPDDPLAPIGSEDVSPGFPIESARYFLFRGVRIKGFVAFGHIFDENGLLIEDVEAEPYYQVGLVGWNNAGAYGAVNESGTPSAITFRVVRWLEPKSFGYNFKRLAGNGEWAALVTGDAKIEILPINAYVYRWSQDHESAWMLFPMLLLSTGTATKSGTLPAAIFGTGLNTNNETNPSWGAANDRAAFDMGLGIPNELVSPNQDLHSQFTSGFGRVRYAYGPDGYESYKMIESLIRPRGLHLTLRNNRFGVQRWELDPTELEATITQSDLRGPPGDPSSVRPGQTIKATGEIDGIVLTMRKNIDDVDAEFSTSKNISQKARDPGVSTRSGDRILKLDEHGLVDQGKLRTFWAFDMPEFFSKRHFMVTGLRISREVGQDLAVGSRITLSNPWIIDTAGNVGVTGAVGIVTSISLSHDDEVYVTSCLIYAGQFGDGPRVFMPIGKISSISGATVTLESDFLSHGEGSDSEGFDVAGFMSGGSATVQILSWDRSTWTLNGSTQTVSSVSGDVVNLDGAFASEPNIYHDRYLICANYDNQAASSWPLAHGMVTSLADSTFGTGPTDAFKYIDKED